jgi:uncharacterized membrane protein YhiD involved in acid resistance
MKNLKQRLLKGALILAIAVVVTSILLFVLASLGVIDKNPFQLGFVVLTVGIGLIFTGYGAITKGGYELAVGLTVILVGICVALIGILKWWIILIIAVGLILLSLLTLALVKANNLIVERTDEKPDFKSYSEVLAEKKAEDAKKEAEPLPELKDYSKDV